MTIRLYRSVEARSLLNIMIVSAVSSILVLRWYLDSHGWPTIGGVRFHVAHMLWGGLLMLIAIMFVMTFMGKGVMKLVALLGGIGFGIFIDELGKFITRDTDYWYHPTIGLIYAIFVIIYLVGDYLTKDRVFTSREYQLNAIQQLEEAVAADMDPYEKRQVLALLAQADQKDPLTTKLTELIQGIETVDPPPPSRLQKLKNWFDQKYLEFWRHRHTESSVGMLFVGQAVAILLATIIMALYSVAIVTKLIGLPVHDDTWINIGQLAGSSVAAMLALYGAWRITKSHLRGLQWFERAIMVNLLFTEYFAFTRWEFWALPGLAFNLVLLALVNLAQSAERRQAHSLSTPAVAAEQ